MKKHISHGEVNLFSGAVIPSNAKRIQANGGKYIVGDSETIGNFHCVEAITGVELYELNGVLYLKNDVQTKVFCPNESRHDSITLEPGVWEIEKAKEYDYLKEEIRNVAD